MIFSTLVAKFGDSDSAIARALGTTRQLVAHWRRKGISESRAAWIRERLTAKKKVKAKRG